VAPIPFKANQVNFFRNFFLEISTSLVAKFLVRKQATLVAIRTASHSERKVLIAAVSIVIKPTIKQLNIFLFFHRCRATRARLSLHARAVDGKTSSSPVVLVRAQPQ